MEEENRKLLLLDAGTYLRDIVRSRWLQPEELYLMLTQEPTTMGFCVGSVVSQTPRGVYL